MEDKQALTYLEDVADRLGRHVAGSVKVKVKGRGQAKRNNKL